jgi:Flp pilus assembly pilin Flp
MLKRIRTITKQKGQGIVEYALLLAFIVGIAMMLNGANLSGAVKDTFDSVANLLGGESVALSPKEADKQKILQIGNYLQDNFVFGDNFGVNTDGKMVLKGDYVCVYVTGDGTADIHVQGKTGNQGWYSLNPNLFNNNNEKPFYDSMLTDLALSDKSKWAPGYTETDSQWSNGYAVMYGKDGKVSYWNMDSSLNSNNFRNVNPTDPGGRGVDKSWLYKAHVSGAATSAVQDNNYVGMHTRITGITD